MCAARSPRIRWRPVVLGVALAALGSSSAAAAPAQNESESTKRTRRPMSAPPGDRAFAVGVEGAVTTTPPLRSRVVYIDPRFLGRSTALGGLGVFGRYRPLSMLGFDVNVRTGSLRLRAEDDDTSISTDQVLADVGAMLYVGRGKVSQFAFSGGLGGQFQRVRYELDSGLEGTQSFGAFSIRVGADAEFLVGRIAFVLSFRTYGIVTPRERTRTSGSLFEGRSGEDTHAPVATFQTYLAGSAGIAYRF